MRAKRAGLAILLAIFGYITSIAATPLLVGSGGEITGVATIARPVIGVAYADTASAQCSANYSGNQQECAKGFRLFNSNNPNQTAQAACSSEPQGSQAACQQGFGLAQKNAQTQGAVNFTGGTNIDQNKCDAASSTFGWALCPFYDSVANFLSTAARDLLEQFLAVQPLQMSGPLFQTWSVVRLLANIFFIIIFLVIIFANILQIDVDAYSIQKMIPKIVGGVVLVQFSYVLSSAIIDVGNILGSGIGALLVGVLHSGATSGSPVQYIVEDLTGAVATGSLAALAYTSGVALAPIIIVLVLIAALGFVVVMAVRYFLIGLLIVASPLALAAWVLPNTEAFFSRWLSTLVKLMLMYPIIMALLSVAADVGALIPNSTGGSTLADIGNSLAASVIKLLVLAACFGAVPATFKWAGGAMSAAYEQIGSLTKMGLNAHWNSSGSQARRSVARNRRLLQGERIADGLAGTGGGRFTERLGRIPGARTRKWLAGPAIKLFSGAPTDKSDRRLAMNAMVKSHGETIEALPSAQDSHNLEHALMAYNLGEQAKMLTGTARKRKLSEREGYLGRLRAANAEEVLDFVGTDLRREAMMNVLSKRNSLKPSLLEAIQKTQTLAKGTGNASVLDTTRREQAAFMRQSFSAYDKQPVVSGLTSDGHLKPNVTKKFSDLDARKIAGDFSDRNFEVMASIGTAHELTQAQEAAELFSKTVGAGYLQLNFTHGHVAEMSGEKKMQALLMMARSDAYNSGPGKEMKRVVVKQILDDNDTGLLEMVREKAVKDAAEKVRQDHPDWGKDAVERQAAINARVVLENLNNTDAGRLYG